MRKIKQIGMSVITVAMIFCMLPVLPTKAEESETPGVIVTDSLLVGVHAADSGTLSYNYAETKKMILTVTNMGTMDAANIRIIPRVNENIDVWPFEIANKNYAITVETLAAGKKAEVEFEFTARENVKTQYYKLAFDYTYSSADDVTKGDGEYGIYVKTVEKPKKDKEENNNQTNTGGGTQGGTNTSGGNTGGGGANFPMDAGGVSNSEPMMTSGGGGGNDATGSVPRVIVTGFTTDPGEVKAGSNFKLTIHLKNTSKKTAVNNMLFDLNAPTEGADENTSAPAFLPSSGSSSVFLDGIKADGTADISIDLNAKSDLVQKPYSVQLSMKYEDTQAAQFESASAVSIPVKQDARFEFSEFQISPETIAVGDEANVMCELHNLGRLKLYNVKAKFEGKGIKSEEVFVGNVESGANVSIDGMVSAEKATQGAKTMKMTMSYEDESGKVSTVEKEFQLEISEMAEDMAMMDVPMEEAGGKFPVIPVAIGVVVVAGGVAGAVIYKKKKKKRQEEEEEGLADEFDRLTEDEPRES